MKNEKKKNPMRRHKILAIIMYTMLVMFVAEAELWRISEGNSLQTNRALNLFVDGSLGIGITNPPNLLTIRGDANTTLINLTAQSGQTNISMMRADGTAVICGVDNTNIWSCS